MAIDTSAYPTLTVTGSAVIAPGNIRAVAAQQYALGLAAEVTGWGKLQHGLGEIYAEWRLAQQEASGTGAGLNTAATFSSANSVARIAGGYVAIDAVAADGDGAALLATLRGLGLIQGASFKGMAGGLLPMDAIDDLVGIANLSFAQPVYASTNVGTVTSQDDAALRADDLRAALGVNGSGVTVGILSDSFNTRVGPITTYAQDVASGDLPAGVNILLEGPAASSDEGRAMAQLVYDIAPGVNLAFHSAFISQASFAAGIVALAGIARVVVDDVFYFNEPAFQDGIIAQAVDQAVDLGAIYFSSAGNQAARGYESAYRASGSFVNITGGVAAGRYQYHDFDPGAGVATTQQITLGTGAVIVLQWDQAAKSAGGASAGSNSDMAIVVFNSGGQAVAVVNTANIGADPVEIAGTFSAGTYFIGLLLRDGHVAPGLMNYRVLGGTYTANTFSTPSATSYGHSNAAGAIGVAAVPWFSTPDFGVPSPVPETFTSRGGLPILYDGDGQRLASPLFRTSVEFAATDGGNTTFFSADSTADADTFPNFFGTSAAAPNAAAVAALLISKFPTATNAQITEALRLSAIDITTGYAGSLIGVGPDVTTGAGLIQAPAAAAALQALLSAQAAAAGSANRIAFIGYNTGQSDASGNPPTTDSLSFVALTALTEGTVIYITDRSWNGTAFVAGSGDGTFAYTVPAGGVAAGTVITLSQAQLIAAGVDLSENGDSIYAYIGATADATPMRFLHALEIGDADQNFDGSLLNTGLVANQSAVAAGFDSGAYVGPTYASVQTSGQTLFGAVSTSANWAGGNRTTVNAVPQLVQDGPWLVNPEVTLFGVGSGGGGGLFRVSQDATVSGGASGFNPTLVFNGLTAGSPPVLYGPRDIVVSPVTGQYFLLDTNGAGGQNRILTGNIAQFATGASSATLNVLYSNGLATEDARLGAIAFDARLSQLFFTQGGKLYRIATNEAVPTATMLFDADQALNPAGGSGVSFNDIAIDFATGNIYLTSSVSTTGASGDIVSANYVYHLSGLTAASAANSFTFDASNTGTARLLPFSPNDGAYNPTAGTGPSPLPGTAASYAFPVEYGALNGLAIDPTTNRLYFTSRELSYDHDGSAGTAPIYAGGVIGSYNLTGNASGAYTILFQQPSAAANGPGLLGDIEIDPVSGRYYVLDLTGDPGANADQAIYTGFLTAAGAPTLFANQYSVIPGFTLQGIAINRAPTLGATATSATLDEAAGAGSGESNRVALYASITVADVDTADSGNEFTSLTVRIAAGAQPGDVLLIDGATSGVTASGIAFNFDATRGRMTLSGAAGAAPYVDALARVTLSTTGDNPTAYGTAPTRTIVATLSDGANVSRDFTATVTIVALNDAPVNPVPGSPLSAAEDVPVSLTMLRVSDADADPATQKLTVTLAASSGTFTVSTTIPGGLTPNDIAGNGTASVTLTGTQNELNTLFAAALGVRYVRNDNGSAVATITMTTSDQGASGGAAQSDVDSFAVNVADTNEAPVLGAISATGAALENILTGIAGAGTVTDADSVDFAGGTLTVAFTFNAQSAQDQLRIVSNGSLTVSGNVLSVSGTDVGTFTGGGAGAGALVISFNAAATPAAAQAVLRGIAYLNTSDAPTTSSRSITYTLVDGDGTAGGGTDTVTFIQAISVTAVNDAPAGVDATRTTAEDTTLTLAAVDFPFTDPENNALSAVVIDSLPTSGTLLYDSDGAGPTAPVAVTVGQVITAADLAAGRLTFVPTANANGSPYASFGFRVRDGGGTTNGGIDTDPVANTLTINVTPVDDLPVAVADAVSTPENVVVTALAVVANDTDIDGGPKAVATIAGQAVVASSSVTLPSGATVTLNADGTLRYNPNNAFNYLISPAQATATGAQTPTQATDSFTYTLNGGSSTTVTVTVTGVDGTGDRLNGGAGDNSVTGTSANDYIDLSQGGADSAVGGDGNDAIFFGTAFGAGDTADGGAGTNDQLGLQGNYPALTLSGTQVTGVEVVAVLPGFSYAITTTDDLIAAGGKLTFYANPGAGNSFSLNASAETNGTLLVYGGAGSDTIVTGAGNDGIYFGPGAFNAATDTVNGGAGTNDQFALDGDYTLTLTGAMLQNIEVIALLAGTPADNADYVITLADSLVASGGSLTLYAVSVSAPVTIDASAEVDGAIRIFGALGNDTLTGGGGADWIWGNSGDDTLRGGGGADRFHFTSPAGGVDTIADFSTAQGDKIELLGSGFGALAGGPLSVSAFVVGGAATTADQRVVYDSATGNLFWDADGSGAGAAVLIAKLTGAPALAAADFVIV